MRCGARRHLKRRGRPPGRAPGHGGRVAGCPRGPDGARVSHEVGAPATTARGRSLEQRRPQTRPRAAIRTTLVFVFLGKFQLF